MTVPDPGVAPDLSVVVVSWNVRGLLARCLAALPAAVVDADGAALAWELIVVDNASSDGTPAMVKARFPAARLIETGANLGFAGGVNVGLAAARGRHLAILNADTEPGPGSLSTLARHLDAHPAVGLVGPRLVYPDGAAQSSRRRFPTRATLFLESTFLEDWFPANPAVRRYRLDDDPAARTGPVDWLVGAALVVRAAAYRAAGGLDEGFFMYSEELEWAKRLHDRGWLAHYVAGATVVHHEGKSSEQNLAARHTNFQRSKLRYARLAFGSGVEARLRAFLLLNYAYRLAEELAKFAISPRLRDVRKRRLRAYWRTWANLTPRPPSLAGKGGALWWQPRVPPATPPSLPGHGAGGLGPPLAHQYQHEHGVANDCGPYSASIALRHWHPKSPGGKAVGRLIRARVPWPAAVRGATLPYGLKRFFAARGFRARSGVRGRLPNLERAIRAGTPTIVLVRPAGSAWLTRHYRVLVAYDRAARRFHFVDPGLPDARRNVPGNHSVDYDVFWREWHGGGWGPLYRRWFLPVRPRRDRTPAAADGNRIP